MLDQAISWMAILAAFMLTLTGAPLALAEIEPLAKPFVFDLYPGQYAGWAWLAFKIAGALLMFSILRAVLVGAATWLLLKLV